MNSPRTNTRTLPIVALIVALALYAAACGDDAGDEGEIQQGTLIRLADGMVQGEIEGGTRRFLGIPFAAPPVGDLRWRPPAPVIPWEGVREATQFGGRCAQLPSLTSLPSEGEDCLYLNVWTPEPAPPEPLPVMVWLHGGSNLYGSASDPWPFGLGELQFDGRVLSEARNVIVVTINYRVGVFGFFTHASLAAEDAANTGNQGLLDQRAALEWVRKNIVAFGGDRDNVTIFGQSAGGFDVCVHVVSPGSWGLFRRAIGQSAGAPGGKSGGCTTRLRTAAEAEANAEDLITTVGCDADDDTLRCLRGVPVPDLVQTAGSDFVPFVDGAVLPDQPRTLFDSGELAMVPYILGSNADEGTLSFVGVLPVTTEEAYLAALSDRWGDLADKVAAVYPSASFPSQQDALARAYGDFFLVCPTYDLARRAAAAGVDVWLYNFARPVPLPQLAPLKLGATHGAEVGYVFWSLDLDPSLYPIDLAISEAMQGYWTRFARSGDPNGEGALLWPRYGDASDQRLNFDAELSVISGFRRAECEFWWGVYDAEFE